MLTDAGVQLVPFSPLHDSQLPPGLSAVLVGGGPVVDWTEQLSANVPMLEALRAFSSAGGFVLGEGAGLMYLSKSLQQPGQRRYELGESHASCLVKDKLAVRFCLGYVLCTA